MDPVTEKNEKAYDGRAQQWRAAMVGNYGHKHLEKPAMAELVPDSLEGKIVLCVGVGSGEELELIMKRNPKKAVAIDISSKLLEMAKSRFPQVEFLKMDMSSLAFPDGSFDFVYSSLAFHYARDWDVLLAGVRRVMKRGGTLLFSTHHPAYWGAKTPTGNVHANPRGVVLTEHVAILPGDVEVAYFNHADEDSVREALVHAGFAIGRAFSPRMADAPAEVLVAGGAEAYAKLKAKNERSPLFFVVKAERGGG